MKRVINKTLVIFVVALLAFTNISLNIKANESLDKKVETQVIKEFNLSGRKSYYTGEEVLVYVKLALTDDIGSIDDSILEISIPKKHVEKNSIEGSGLSTSEYTVEIVEDADNYIVRYRLKLVTSANEVEVPLRFKTDSLLTPNNHKINLIGKYTYGQQSISTDLEIDIKTGHFNGDIHISDEAFLGHTNQSGKKLNAGIIDLNNPEYLSTNPEKLNSIKAAYSLHNKKEEIGNRRFKELQIKYELPEGSMFVQKNGWKYDESTHTATLIDKGIYGAPINVGDFSTVGINDLHMKFPGGKIGDTKTIELSITGIPYDQGINEEVLIVSDKLHFILDGENEKLTEFYASKTSFDEMVDHSSDRHKEINWSLAFDKKSNEKELTSFNITDYELDNRLKYDGITVVSHGYLSTMRVDIDVRLSDDSLINIVRGYKINESKRFDFKDVNIKEVIIKPSKGFKLNSIDKIEVVIHTSLIDKDSEIGIAQSDNRFYNKALFEVQYKDETKQVVEKIATAPIKRLDSRVYLERSINNKVQNYFVRNEVDMSLIVKAEDIVENHDEIKLNSIIEILPDGIHYVEDSATITLGKNVISKLNDGELEPKVVYDYKGTGKTALIWDLETISIQGEDNLINSTEALIKINYKSVITEFTEKGENNFQSYLYVENVKNFPAKNGVEDILNIANNDGSKIEYNVGTINYSPTKEFFLKKEVKGSLNENYRLTPNVAHTEVNEELQYRVTIMNNKESALEDLYLMDIFPYEGDKSHSINKNRESTLSLSLKGPISIPKEFNIYYTEEVPGGNLKEYYKGNHWSSSMIDYSNVKAIKLELKEGESLKSEYKNQFEMTFIAPKDVVQNKKHQSVNSVFASQTKDLDFIESNTATAILSQYLIEGTLFHDVNKNGRYDAQIDKHFKGIEVGLYNKDNTPVLDYQGEKITTTTNEEGYYAFGIINEGSYKIKILGLEGYAVSNLGDLSNVFDSHLNQDKTSKIATLNKSNKKITLNAGLYKELIEITVDKVWIDGPYVHPTIEIQLYRNGEVFESPILLDNGELSYTWTNLDKTDSEGNDYEYTVDELTDLENYNKEVSGHTITNTYTSPKTSFTVNKVWIDGPDVHPTIEIQLYRNGEVFESPILLDNGELSYTWTNLDKTDSEGNDYEYTVDELTDLENYNKEVNGHTITNTYTSPKTSFTVNKVWVDGPDVHPTIEIQLYRNGEVFESPISLGNGALSYTWIDLDKTDSEGNDYEYTVDELTDLENYNKEVSGHTITNIYTSPKTSFTVNKVWIDGPDVHPTIEIQLYRNGEVFESPISLENGELSYTWTDLDKTDLDGNDYEYTVDELTEVEHYTKEVKGNIIINTYSEKVFNDPKTEMPNTGQSNSNEPKNEMPNTGLSSSKVAYFNLLIISTLTIIISGKKRKKNNIY